MTAPQLLIQSAISRGWIHLAEPKVKAPKIPKPSYDPERYRRKAEANRALGLTADGKPRKYRRWGLSNRNHAEYNRQWRKLISSAQPISVLAAETSGPVCAGLEV